MSHEWIRDLEIDLLVVTDLWPTDAGKLHSWTLSFNPMIVQNCSGPIIQ
jgi:subtilisin-like proprotein convertase family protein